MKKTKEKTKGKSVRISTTITYTLWDYGRIHNLSWSKCCERGIVAFLRDRKVKIFENPEKTREKIQELKQIIGKLNEEIAVLREKKEDNSIILSAPGGFL